METYQTNATIGTTEEQEVRARQQEIQDEEIRPRRGMAGAFLGRVILTSAAVFLFAIGLETLIIHFFIDQPTVSLVRKLIVLSIGGALTGAVLGIIVGLGMVMKKHYNMRHAMITMGVFLVLTMLGIAILGQNPLFHW